jgi:hypothetical protein
MANELQIIQIYIYIVISWQNLHLLQVSAYDGL